MEELEKLKTLLNSFEPVTIQKAINEIEEVKQETNVIIPEVVQVVEKKKSVGCPLKFTCKEEMQVLGEKYFKEAREHKLLLQKVRYHSKGRFFRKFFPSFAVLF